MKFEQPLRIEKEPLSYEKLREALDMKIEQAQASKEQIKSSKEPGWSVKLGEVNGDLSKLDIVRRILEFIQHGSGDLKSRLDDFESRKSEYEEDIKKAREGAQRQDYLLYPIESINNAISLTRKFIEEQELAQ